LAWLLTGQRTGIEVNVKLSTNSIDSIMRFGVSKKVTSEESPYFQLLSKRQGLVVDDKLFLT
jgi:hypothetical protein